MRESRSEPNVLAERSLLAPAKLASWEGLPLCWVEASPHVDAVRVVSERPRISMIDAGEAEAEFGFALHSQRLDVSAGAMGLFEASETRYCRWRCAFARRIIVDLDFESLQARGLDLDGWASARLQQDLEFRDPQIGALLRAMAGEVADGCPNGRLQAESLSLALAARVIARHARVRAPARERGRLTPAQLARIDDYIECNLDGSITLAQLAGTAGLSAPHFARLMRNAAGCSPHRYVLDRRIRRARELLERTTMPLAAVAAATGFASQSHMNAVLLGSLGATPGQLRQLGARRLSLPS